MTAKHEPVRLVLDDNFTDGMQRAREAALSMHAEHVLRQATWEPHDWTEWS